MGTLSFGQQCITQAKRQQNHRWSGAGLQQRIATPKNGPEPSGALDVRTNDIGQLTPGKFATEYKTLVEQIHTTFGGP